jgi:endonuclease V-like protein UPF0215 family
MHIPKKGLRALGIAESFAGRKHSTLAGVVMRKDLQIDGFVFGRVTVGGMDATDTIIGMVSELDRRDINVIMLSGCVIAWFNIIDPAGVFNKTNIPVIGITYEASEGLSADIRFHFPGDTSRLAAYEQLGERTPMLLHTGQTIFIRTWGIGNSDAIKLCDDFTLEGKIPEPLRVARLCARSILQKSER